jgi:AbiV family abortive infection protein
MGYGYSRVELRKNAQSKLDDAVVLLENGSFSNAYYLSGYAVEIGLKACIAAQISAETVPDKELLKYFLQHDLERLIGLAGLKSQFKAQKDQDRDFSDNWAFVSKWTPDVRYEEKDLAMAQTMIEAIGEQKSGVLQWIKAYW